ncbi:hypothetical protein ACIGEL_21355 [Rossellomorea aquimaris]|uniref:hypothetical protein n=1 Tax=Rossellomorea aquimaris TaxID=189382 RepID=UPI0037C64128
MTVRRFPGKMPSMGETLMNASVLVAATPIPGAQIIGAGMAAVGGIMWLGATAYKYRKNSQELLDVLN